jgi:hypothetical protein
LWLVPANHVHIRRAAVDFFQDLLSSWASLSGASKIRRKMDEVILDDRINAPGSSPCRA